MLKIVRTEELDGVKYIVYDADFQNPISKLQKNCILAYGFLNIVEKSLGAGNASTGAITLLGAAFGSIAKLYAMVLKSDYSAQKAFASKGYILYLRDFGIAFKNYWEQQGGQQETREYFTYLSLEYGEHSFLPAIRHEFSDKEVVGLVNPQFLLVPHKLHINMDAKNMMANDGAEPDGRKLLEFQDKAHTNLLRLQENSWQREVNSLIKNAHGIVLYLSSVSGGTDYELSSIQELGRAADTVVFYGKKVTKGSVRNVDEIRKRFPEFENVFDIRTSSQVKLTDTEVELSFTEDAQAALQRIAARPVKPNEFEKEDIDILLNRTPYLRERPTTSLEYEDTDVVIPSYEADNLDRHIENISRIELAFEEFQNSVNNQSTNNSDGGQILALAADVFITAALFEDRKMMIKSLSIYIETMKLMGLHSLIKMFSETLSLLQECFNKRG